MFVFKRLSAIDSLPDELDAVVDAGAVVAEVDDVVDVAETDDEFLPDELESRGNAGETWEYEVITLMLPESGLIRRYCCKGYIEIFIELKLFWTAFRFISKSA